MKISEWFGFSTGLCLALASISAVSATVALRSQQHLTVLDSTGKRIGRVVGNGNLVGTPLVALTADDRLLVLGADSTRFYGSDAVLLFESNDCSSPPFMEADRGGLLPRTVVWTNRVFVPVGNEAARLLTMNSVVFVEPDTAVCQDRSAEPQELVATPAREVVDLAQHFTPPFHLR
jgi:hypothetical protein